MANSLFGGPAGILMQVASTVNKIKQDPSMLGRFLLDHGKINDSQLQEINKMGGNYDQIGNYLINNNIMSQQDANALYQTACPQCHK